MQTEMHTLTLPDGARGARPALRPAVDFRVLDDLSGVAVDPAAAKAHALNPVATAILERCDGTLTVAAIADEIADIFDGPADRIATDVERFVGDLAEKGLIEW